MPGPEEVDAIWLEANSLSLPEPERIIVIVSIRKQIPLSIAPAVALCLNAPLCFLNAVLSPEPGRLDGVICIRVEGTIVIVVPELVVGLVYGEQGTLFLLNIGPVGDGDLEDLLADLLQGRVPSSSSPGLPSL